MNWSLIGVVITLAVVALGAAVELYIHFHSGGFHRRPARFKLGKLEFWALGDRVLIQEDEFKSGYECSGCDGRGKCQCGGCQGSGQSRVVSGAKCKDCEGSGVATCPVCGGKGGLLIAPDISQRRPTSGVIVSAGHRCRTLKVGQSVLYSNFAGYAIDLTGRAGESVVLRVLHETEVLTGMEGQLSLTNLKGKTDIAQFTP